MGKITVTAQGHIHGDPATVYSVLADMREHHPKILPPAFSDFTVEEGGVGAGTITSFRVTTGGRTRQFRTVISEPEPGRVLQETDQNSSTVTTFTVDPVGDCTDVTITSSWDGAGGIGGFFERTFAPRALGRLLREELDLLNQYVHHLPGTEHAH